MIVVRTFPMFRSVDPKSDLPDQFNGPKKTKRGPGNVPYVVDNLWEWKRWKERPDYPCRRFSVFASPSIDLARASGPAGGTVYRVELAGDFKLCQVTGRRDSKYHDECRSLPKKLLKGLGQERLGQEWLDGRLKQKEEAGRLWLPCLDPDEVESLFDGVPSLRRIRDEIWGAIRYWEGVTLIKDQGAIPNLDGELFFEPLQPAGGYYLRGIA